LLKAQDTSEPKCSEHVEIWPHGRVIKQCLAATLL